jgi:hypothetical protein
MSNISRVASPQHFLIAERKKWASLYKFAGAAALVALAVNVLDVLLGFGETEIIVNGRQSAPEWFGL